jgi:ABC-type lipoprotein release transport system permease subunit
LGEDADKPSLNLGDTFRINELNCIVSGIMKAEGTTFGSEIWVQNIDLVTRTFGKQGNFTTLVLRVEQNTLPAARAMAFHLQSCYTQQKLKAVSEPEYYSELTKTNDQFLTWIVAIAVVMAIGGVFGVMNTQFASIAARMKEVGVLRILGFKRWQILISFMIESLLIAIVGGVLGCLIGSLIDGYEAKSTLSAGPGGGSKSVSLVMLVNYETLATGLLFTLMMGRIGGLVPALSAMRLTILNSLK